MRKILLLAVISFITLTVHAQQNNVLTSAEMLEKALSIEAKNKKELDEYFAKHPNEKRVIRLANGEMSVAICLSPSGKPLYYQVDNADAAEDTRIDVVRDGFVLGRTFGGTNVPVVVWDGGKVRDTHQELVGRTDQKDNASSLSNHATHVTGTILAAGVSPSAKGMAPLAIANTYDFNNDFPEMAAEANAGTILSNHSYGFPHGWTQSSAGDWSWNGDESVSTEEDYLFGFYHSQSAAWDELAYSNPYYLMVKSAGNHRTDNGDRSVSNNPPDGPYDIISITSVPKNILTVGAVEKVAGDINNPENIAMTSFSSWGPTDDGRIKPDLCGVGRQIRSSFSSADNAYGSLQGTSMSTPNVTGGLVVLQEVAKHKTGNYLRSATLKGLAIHAVTQTGEDYGPDYEYGWGLFNAERSAKILDNFQADDKIGLLEETLADGATNEYNVSLEAGETFIATICWTDLAGAPETVASLDPETLKLVHDLDMRIEEVSTSTVFSPYVIDPSDRSLSTGDNFRDNVEKIRFEAPSTGTYKITVSHKSDLQTASQNFALIYSTEEAIAAYDVLYFTGVDQDFDVLANFEDVASNPATNLPTAKTVLFIEADNATESAVTLDADLHVKALVVNGSSTSSLAIDLGGHDIYTERLVTNDIPLTFTNGNIFIQSADVAYADAIVNGTGVQVMVDAPKVEIERLEAQTVSITRGAFVAVPTVIKADDISFGASTTATNLELTVEVVNSFDNQSSQITLANAVLSVMGNATINAGGAAFATTNIAASTAPTFSESLTTDVLNFAGDANVTIGEEKTLAVNNVISFDPANAISLSSSGEMNATFSYTGDKLCDAPFTIDKVDFAGGGKLVIALSTTITNATGWQQIPCSDILDANFTAEGTCAPGLLVLNDVTDGTPTSWVWTIVTGTTTLNSTEQNPKFEITELGSYTITMEVSSATDSDTHEATIEVRESNLNKPELSYQNGRIVSSVIGTQYRWYRNGELLAGLNDSRITPPEFSGVYHVEIILQGCIVTSDEVAFSVLDEDDEFLGKELLVYPNPILDVSLRIESTNGPIEKVEVYAPTGNLVNTLKPAARQTTMSFDGLPKGLYLIHIHNGNSVNVVKVVY